MKSASYINATRYPNIHLLRGCTAKLNVLGFGVSSRGSSKNTVLKTRFGTVPEVGQTYEHVGGADPSRQVFALQRYAWTNC
jgi:hypothetical protein